MTRRKDTVQAQIPETNLKETRQRMLQEISDISTLERILNNGANQEAREAILKRISELQSQDGSTTGSKELDKLTYDIRTLITLAHIRKPEGRPETNSEKIEEETPDFILSAGIYHPTFYQSKNFKANITKGKSFAEAFPDLKKQK